MSIGLPQSGDTFVPEVPKEIAKDQVLYDYLQQMQRSINRVVRGMFTNDQRIVNAINSGTSGTFTVSSGGSIIVTSGIVIRVTS